MTKLDITYESNKIVRDYYRFDFVFIKIIKLIILNKTSWINNRGYYLVSNTKYSYNCLINM